MKIRNLVLYGLNTAIVFVSCYFLNVQLPISVNGGLIHLGNIALFTIAMLFGRKQGAVAGAFGMALFDLASPWAIWAPGTFVIRGIMGYLIGYFYERREKNKVLFTVFAIVIPSIEMIAGYYLYEVLIYGNWVQAATSIPGDIIQLVIGYAAAIPLYMTLSKISVFKRGYHEK